MTLSISELRAAGRADLSGRWGESAMLTFVYFIIVSILQGACSAATLLWAPGLGEGLIGLLLIPMYWGYEMTFLSLHRNQDGDPFDIGHLFDGYTCGRFLRVFTTIFLYELFIILGLVLLIIPGIYLALNFALVPYLIQDNAELRNMSALRLSHEMMRGHRLRLLGLCLSFLGWILLALLFTLGIGLFWVIPYMSASMANFYEDVKADYEAQMSVTAETDSEETDHYQK
jgi:uncharacterized membrane protein